MDNERILLSSREHKKENSVVKVGNALFGDGRFCAIAGPCAVESYEQLSDIAKKVKQCGASVLRGGAFKPRTSPYTFQGLGVEGIDILCAVGKETGLATVTEIMDASMLKYYDKVDMLQVGARSMQNYELLKALGGIDKPVLLKRGAAATLEELLYSAEYILSGGNKNVILCERGIRTFETHTRFTLDIASIPVLKKMSHLPVIFDPSHAAGHADLVYPLAMAAAAAGADGMMLEVHCAPENAECDGEQAITPEHFGRLKKAVDDILPYAYKV